MEKAIQIFNRVLRKGREVNASDVHICVGTPWKYRLNGYIVPLNNLPALTSEESEAIVKHIIHSSRVVPMEDLDRFVRLLKDFDCSYSIKGVSRFRVNICRQRGTFSIVLRVIPFESPTIEAFGMPDIIGEIAMEQRGLVLITGVTGSGKSTTMAAMINRMNHLRQCKIVTIEDPIEFLYNEEKASVIQREVGTDTISFSKALRAALRQDPDVILVGEMRDRETIEIALKAAETGHLVLSTLHTMDAPRTIQRITSVFDLSEQDVLRTRLAESLKAVISQKLIHRSNSKKQIAVFEIMRQTLSIQECIKDPGKTHTIRELIASGGSQYGMQSIDQHLKELYESGMIDLKTAQAASSSGSDFLQGVQFTR